MPEVDYDISKDEQCLLDEQGRALLADVRAQRTTRDELAAIVKLLAVNQTNFERYRAEAWFTKAWMMISGQRGRCIDITLANLGKIHVGVIRVLGELLNDSAGVKEDLLSIFAHLDKIRTESLELRVLLSKFNETYAAKFQQFQADQHRTQRSLWMTQVLVGLTFLSGAVWLSNSTLSIPYGVVGIGGLSAAGLLLMALAMVGVKRRGRAKIPIPLAGQDSLPELRTLEDGPLARTLRYALGESPEEEAPRVFHIHPHVGTLLDYFQLTTEEERLLFSLQDHLTQLDIEETATPDDRLRKTAWLKRWRASIHAQLNRPLVTDHGELFRGLEEVREARLSIPKLGTILLEAVIFQPYFPLGDAFNGQALEPNADHQEERIASMCQALGFSRHLLGQAQHAYEEALEAIPPSTFWYKVVIVAAAAIVVAITGGVAAPVIGGAIGAAMGLSGAAAVSAGLAALGGGAIAAGGLGMAGGTAVLIGGGAMLGAGIAGGLVQLLSTSRQLVLRELAKLEAVARVFLTQLPDAREAIGSVIHHERATRDRLRDECLRLRSQKRSSRESRTAIEELEHSLEYCDRAIRRLEAFVEETTL
jgi:hypothetical protein